MDAILTVLACSHASAELLPLGEQMGWVNADQVLGKPFLRGPDSLRRTVMFGFSEHP